MWESGNLAMFDMAMGNLQWIADWKLAIAHPLPIEHRAIRNGEIARSPRYR